MSNWNTVKDCHDCGVKPGENHKPGCDTERCPACGGQMISCGCLSEKETAAWIEKNLLPWTGIWPGCLEAAAFGWWSRWVDNPPGTLPMGRWEVCTEDTVGASPDLNRLYTFAVWDRETKTWKKRGA